VVGALAGGTLGAGSMSPVSVPAFVLGLIAAVWLAVVGGAAVVTCQWRIGSTASADETAAGDPGSKGD